MADFAKIREHLKPELTAVNRIIREELATTNSLMDEVVTSYLRSKGKQIRPIIVILSAKIFGGVNEHVLYAAASLEMLHNASLIHDDVVDETKLRRGYPTVNSFYGNHLAVLVGDFFVSHALAAGIRTGNISIISALSALGSELAIGEVEQICNARDLDFSESAYLKMIGKKTASLFVNCVKMGAEASGATQDEYLDLTRYAEYLGLCFQIKDDIFDYFDSGTIGKPTGNDLREGKVSLPLLYALRTADSGQVADMKKLLRKDTLSDSEIHTLINFATANGGIEYSFAKMRELECEANDIIAVYGDNPTVKDFKSIFEYIISRDK